MNVTEIKKLFSEAGDKYLLLFLVESAKRPLRAKPGVQSLSYRVLGRMIEAGGPLDESLTRWSADYPRVQYRRVVVDSTSSEIMTTLGVVWLPQVRLVRRGVTLFRSAVSMGSAGDFIPSDVGGRSYVRRNQNHKQLSLTDALTLEVEKGR